MVAARKETFGSQWPYDGKKGWKPTSKKLAEAGFYFTPTEEEEDNAKCIYCEKALGGWEKGDDPVHEHKRRNPDCAFFNCALREAPPVEEPEVEQQAIGNEADEELELVVPTKKGGKRAVSTTRKASAKVGKAKKSTAAKAQEEDEDVPASQAEASVTPDTAAEEAASEEPVVPTAPTAKKAARKTRTVSTRKAEPKSDIEDTPSELTPVPASTSTSEEPAKPATRKKAGTGLGNVEQPIATRPTRAASRRASNAIDHLYGIKSDTVGTTPEEPANKKAGTGLGNADHPVTARPSRAASRRATKALQLLSADDDVDRIPRRPDEEDIKKREMALSDPIPFPSSEEEEERVPMPATDPVEPMKAKKSRSKSKKLPTPEPEEPVEEMENTIIEHEESEVEEVVEEPKRRGGRGGKSASASSSGGSKGRKVSNKVAEPAAEEEEEEPMPEVEDSVVFPSMSSPVASHRQTSSRSVSSALNALSSSNKSSKDRNPSLKHSGTSSVPPSSAPPTSEFEVDSSLDPILSTLGSQATIRGPRSSNLPNSDERVPLSQLPPQTQLGVISEKERGMTFGDWLMFKAEQNAAEMRRQGEEGLENLERELKEQRGALERRLRGRA